MVSKIKRTLQEQLLFLQAFMYQLIQLMRGRSQVSSLILVLEKNVFFSQIIFLFKGCVSSDRSTRWVSRVFFGAFFCLLIVFFQFMVRVQQANRLDALKANQLKARNLLETERKASEIELRRSSLVSFGSFVVELKEDLPEPQPKVRLRTKMVELEIVAFCDSSQTRNFLFDHLEQVRSQVTAVLGPVSRSELLSVEGKRQLKELLKKRLNHWLPMGKISDLYIPRMIID